MELGSGSYEPDHQERPFRQIRVIFSPLYGDLLMKCPLRNRTVGAVRGGQGQPNHLLDYFHISEVLSGQAGDFIKIFTASKDIKTQIVHFDFLRFSLVL